MSPSGKKLASLWSQMLAAHVSPHGIPNDNLYSSHVESLHVYFVHTGPSRPEAHKASEAAVSAAVTHGGESVVGNTPGGE